MWSGMSSVVSYVTGMAAVAARRGRGWLPWRRPARVSTLSVGVEVGVVAGGVGEVAKRLLMGGGCRNAGIPAVRWVGGWEGGWVWGLVVGVGGRVDGKGESACGVGRSGRQPHRSGGRDTPVPVLGGASVRMPGNLCVCMSV